MMRSTARLVAMAVALIISRAAFPSGLVLAEGPAPSGAASLAGANDPSVRIKDIARIRGVRDNQLIGTGLVVGLQGTGDGSGTIANVQMVANMLRQFNITVSPEQMRVKNVAAVAVTADLPAFARSGDKLDVVVSSLGDAKSLQGGMLLFTPLRGADGKVYALAQGPVSIGGFSVGSRGTSVQKNFATVGRVPGGATVEQEVPTSLGDGNTLTVVLARPDFTTAARLAEVINRVFTPQTARALDQSAVEIAVPAAYRQNLVEFIANLEGLPVRPDAVARVVVNERTGTIVVGHQVRISTVAVSHGNLSIKIAPADTVSQPPPLSGGGTVVAPRAEVGVQEPPAEMVVLQSGSSVNDLVRALNAVGATPRDIIAVLQAIKEVGALQGQLEIM
ncbi:MAG: flagellar basal body P-ring protein FlgI [Firmicutes bacterium]|nr:flagellar basal body P-ring protein FlgI [Bacillota bacterium]